MVQFYLSKNGRSMTSKISILNIHFVDTKKSKSYLLQHYTLKINSKGKPWFIFVKMEIV